MSERTGEQNGGKEGARRGRPRIVEQLARERAGSVGGIEEFLFKRKRDDGMEAFGEANEEEGTLSQPTKRSLKLGKEEMEERCDVDLWKVIKGLRLELKGLRKEVEQLKREGEEWKGKIKVLEERLGMEVGNIGGGGEHKTGAGEDGSKNGKLETMGKGIEERVRGMEKKLEWREKEERRRRVVIKGVRPLKGDLKWGVDQLMREIGAQVEINEMRRVRTGKEEWGEMVVVKLGSEGEKKEVMEKKKMLKGRKIWIEEDLTWEERRVRWRLREIAREEERRGRKVWVGQDKIKIEGEWWWWNREREVLVDGMGRAMGRREVKSSGEGRDGAMVIM